MLPETPPPGDLLIHAGDMTNHGRPADLQKQLDWLAAQPHTHKVVICGNHDSWFDPRGRKLKAAELAAEQGEDVTSWEETGGGGPTIPEGIHYLERSSVQLSFPNGRSILVYGAPDIPRCGPDTFAFQYPREDPSIWNDSIPNDVDILVTHPPPRHHLDLELGCVGLLREVWRVRPALHVFGHVHWGAGRTRLWWDDTQRIYEALFGGEEAPLSETWSTLPRRLGLLARLAWTATGYLLWPGTLRPVAGTRTSLLINPAQMYGNTGRLGPNVQVADI